eukprot:TRINITY_DN10635_c0_g1_i1.p1 TRINITY_DN10635_c0_g1~~TRINITY_DN10635_c0_g1_i1.p1  ORF type:complete len:663 (-),score=153.71 TRINITY_DN10635_c0_g1_i1:13-2001(-)
MAFAFKEEDYFGEEDFDKLDQSEALEEAVKLEKGESISFLKEFLQKLNRNDNDPTTLKSAYIPDLGILTYQSPSLRLCDFHKEEEKEFLVRLDFEAVGLLASPLNDYLAIQGRDHCSVLDLSRLRDPRRQLTPMLPVITLTDLDVPIRKIAWHPVSKGRHLVVLSQDNRLRIFKMSKKKSNGTISYLQMISLYPEKMVSFEFGRSKYSDSWNVLSIYLMAVSGRIYGLCPVVPASCHVSPQYLKALRGRCESESKGNKKMQELQWLESISEKPNCHPQNLPPLKIRNPDCSRFIQGPLNKIPGEAKVEASDFLVLETTPTIFIQIFNDGIVQIYFQFEDLKPAWKESHKDLSEFLYLYDILDLSTMPPPSIKPALLPHPTIKNQFFVLSGRGIYRVQLPVTQKLEEKLNSDEHTDNLQFLTPPTKVELLLNCTPYQGIPNKAPFTNKAFIEELELFIVKLDNKWYYLPMDCEYLPPPEIEVKRDNIYKYHPPIPKTTLSKADLKVLKEGFSLPLADYMKQANQELNKAIKGMLLQRDNLKDFSESVERSMDDIIGKNAELKGRIDFLEGRQKSLVAFKEQMICSKKTLSTDDVDNLIELEKDIKSRKSYVEKLSSQLPDFLLDYQNQLGQLTETLKKQTQSIARLAKELQIELPQPPEPDCN